MLIRRNEEKKILHNKKCFLILIFLQPPHLSTYFFVVKLYPLHNNKKNIFISLFVKRWEFCCFFCLYFSYFILCGLGWVFFFSSYIIMESISEEESLEIYTCNHFLDISFHFKWVFVFLFIMFRKIIWVNMKLMNCQ